MKYAFLAVFVALLTGCREKVYVLYGEMNTDAPQCVKYPNITEVEPVMRKLKTILVNSTATWDVNELKQYAVELNQTKDFLARFLTPEFTDLKYTAHFSWKINLNYLKNGKQVVPQVMSRNGFEVPFSQITQKDEGNFRVIRFEGSASLLEICALTKSVQGLLEVQTNGIPDFYYRAELED